jgi:isopenicillin N synthase-like dioxygenase
MAVDLNSGFQLPPWLSVYRDLFLSLMRNGNTICNILLEVLEKQLQVRNGELASLHRFTDPSNDFLRVLRYPGTPKGTDLSQTKFPPHRDAVSIAMLFTWVGGLQILDPKFGNKLQNGTTNGNVNGTHDDGWRWVKPVPGHVIVNLGDALSILTNEVLKSGYHRVITSPGAQQPVDKYSVLLGYRPALTTKMTPLVSSVIPPLTPEQEKAPVLTCEEWGAQRVQKVYTVLENQ